MILITICARGGSKGIPKKNIKLLNGVPLIGYTILVAKRFAKRKKKCSIILSTENNEIKEVAKDFGLESNYTRPDFLSEDHVGKLDVIKHAVEGFENLNNCKVKYVIDLDITSPLRKIEDIEEALKKLKSNSNSLNIFSVSPANRNPYFNMVELKNNSDFVSLVKENKETFKTRQNSPLVFDMNASIYIYKREFFNKNYETCITEKSIIYLMKNPCFDLDHIFDFKIMETLLKEGIINLKL